MKVSKKEVKNIIKFLNNIDPKLAEKFKEFDETVRQAENKKIEQIAALEHERYVIAQTAFLEQIRKDYNGDVFRSVPEMLDWYKFRYANMWKEYNELTETKKSYGRNWAKQIIKTLRRE